MSNTLQAGDNKISAGDEYIFYADPSKHYGIEFVPEGEGSINVPTEITRTCFFNDKNEYTINITANESKIENSSVAIDCDVTASSGAGSAVGGDPYYAKYMKYKNKYAQLAKKLGRY